MGKDPAVACFDHAGLYAYGRQSLICHHNLRPLQDPLTRLQPRHQGEAAPADLEPFVQEVSEPPWAPCPAWRARSLSLASTAGAGAEASIAADPGRRNLPEAPVWPVIEGISAAIDERDHGATLHAWLTKTVSPPSPSGG